MKTAQVQKFKKLLEEKKIELEENLSTIAKRGTQQKGDWESTFPKFDEDSSLEEASDEVEEYISRLPVEQLFELRLKAIGEALQRIKKGTYGTCSNCKQNIPLKRLEALPESSTCLKCK